MSNPLLTSKISDLPPSEEEDSLCNMEILEHHYSKETSTLFEYDSRDEMKEKQESQVRELENLPAY